MASQAAVYAAAPVARAAQGKGWRNLPTSRIYLFTIPGPLLGYRASVRRAHDPKYKAYKEAVYFYAVRAGLPTRLFTSPDCRATLSVQVAWRNRPRIDWSNVYKAIEDALFPQDRYVVAGRGCGLRWATGIELATVEVEVWRGA